MVDTILPLPRRGATSAMMSSQGDAAGNEATCSHQPLLSPPVPTVSPFACDLGPITRSKMAFTTNLGG